jgi:outer membrane protein assembly factor BamB
LAAGDPASPAGETYYLTEEFTHAFAGAELAYATYYGKQVLYFEGGKLVGLDPQTSLVRWQGGNLTTVRQLVDAGDNVLLIGEHLELISKDGGKRVWDFPLNCFDAAQCSADVLARTPTSLLIGGFGSVRNMVQLVRMEDGKEVWPSWATTCAIRKAGLVQDSVVLVCTTANPLVQRMALKSRMTLFTAASPVADFSADDAWYSEKYIFVTGLSQGQRKLYVYGTEKGELVGKFNVKEPAAGKEQGFLVAPETGRFVPWETSGGDLMMWGIDVQTGKAAWQAKLPSGRLVGQAGATALVMTPALGQTTLSGIELTSGRTGYQHVLPFADPTSAMQGSKAVIADRTSRTFIVSDVASGNIDAIGTIPAVAEVAPGKLYFSGEGERFVLLSGTQVTVYGKDALSKQVDELVVQLDSGNEQQALKIWDVIAPFRGVVPKAKVAFREVARYRWLNAEMRLRENALEKALETAATVQRDAFGWDAAEFAFQFPFLARFATQVAMQGSSSVASADYLMETLDLLLLQADVASGPLAEDLVDVAVALAHGLGSSAHASEAVGVLEKLHEKPVLAAYLEAHPYWTVFQVDAVQAVLDEAMAAGESGDAKKGADLLHGLASDPIALQVFEPTFDPWLDAQGLYLLFDEQQAEKLPEVVKALSKKLAAERKRLVGDALAATCRRACETTEGLCASECVTAEACGKAGSRCREGCGSGRSSWKAPAFSVSPASPQFYKCR